MKKYLGFTLIEILIFIVITSILANAIILAFVASLQKIPSVHNQMVATQTAQQCMEWFIGQRRMNGYSSLSCPSTPSPSICTAPSGYSINNSIACTTINGDSNYKTITVTVSGDGDAVFTSLIGNF